MIYLTKLASGEPIFGDSHYLLWLLVSLDINNMGFADSLEEYPTVKRSLPGKKIDFC